jgi:hypothetical protein
VIARGIFTSVKDLARKLRRYIKTYSAKAKPIRWKYPIRAATSAVMLESHQGDALGWYETRRWRLG